MGGVEGGGGGIGGGGMGGGGGEGGGGTGGGGTGGGGEGGMGGGGATCMQTRKRKLEVHGIADHSPSAACTTTQLPGLPEVSAFELQSEKPKLGCGVGGKVPPPLTHRQALPS